MNKKIILLVISAFFCQLLIFPVFAIKAYPFPVDVTQPDGTHLTIQLRGDEYHHFKTTEDGYLLKNNAKGYLTYATQNAAGETVESQVVARNINKRTAKDIQFLKTVSTSEMIKRVQTTPLKSKMLSPLSVPQRQFPLTGTPRSLVILVNFSDKSYVVPTPNAAYTNLLNLDGYSANGGTGSAKDYFLSSSYGKFSPTFDVVGPYTLPYVMGFYGSNDANGNDINPRQMVIDACTAANTAGLDFTQYDTDNDGYVDNVFIYYAGYNEAEDVTTNNINVNTIWPHRWTLANSSTKFDGKIIYDYSCTSELKGYAGSSMCGIGTFCHEFGHVLGLPDYYDTSGTNAHTVDYWDIMDAGAYLNGGRTPPTYSVYDRFFLGYLTPQQISTPSDLTLLPIYQGKTQIANTTNQAFLFSATAHNLSAITPSPKEFFMVEYRKKTGWDAYLPGEGMCIWHIDYDQTAWDNNEPNNYTGSTQTASSHMRVYLQPLVGTTTTPGAAFTTGIFTPTTWTGTDINRAISGITTTADNITFRLMPSKMTSTGSFSGFTTIQGTPSSAQSTDITVSNLTENLNVMLLANTNFDIKLSTGSVWSKSLSIVPVSGSVNATLNVRYNPTSAGSHTDQLGFTSAGLTSVSMSLSGLATTPYDPNTPIINVGRIQNLLQFPVTKVNVESKKTLNIKTTDVHSNLSLVISGTNANLFTVSVSAITKAESNSTTGLNITVSYLPTTIGVHTATLTISGGGLNPDKVITLNGGCN